MSRAAGTRRYYAEPVQPESSGRDRIRAANSDRDAVVAQLNAAFAEGRLDVTELDERVSRAYAATTLGELQPLTADLPRSAAAPTAGVGSMVVSQPVGGAPAPARALDRVWPWLRIVLPVLVLAALGTWIALSVVSGDDHFHFPWFIFFLLFWGWGGNSRRRRYRHNPSPNGPPNRYGGPPRRRRG